MDLFILTLALFIPSVILIELLMYARRLLVQPERSSVRKRVRQLSGRQFQASGPGILRSEKFSDVPTLHRILSVMPVVHDLEKLRKQANTRYPLSVFILISILSAVIVFFVVSQITRKAGLAFLPALIVFAVPWIWLSVRKNARMQKFQRQLPEALDLIARSLKAGHAFTSGLKLTADQFDDPLGTEFEETINEINFGVSISEALKNLANRVDCQDLRFFVVSVILQRETGGNLAEIMENNARLIRERFKFYNHVRTLSAEGKFSAGVLIAIPVIVFLVLYVINYDYMSILLKEPAGNIMLVIAGCMIIAGILMMKKIIRIKA
ncbi:MAG: type II secretion system F family protein [Desulfobacterales bacterium]|nr:type II secretion system F family protein [Desulfobacterales bacterium]